MSDVEVPEVVDEITAISEEAGLYDDDGSTEAPEEEAKLSVDESIVDEDLVAGLSFDDACAMASDGAQIARSSWANKHVFAYFSADGLLVQGRDNNNRILVYTVLPEDDEATDWYVYAIPE